MGLGLLTKADTVESKGGEASTMGTSAFQQHLWYFRTTLTAIRLSVCSLLARIFKLLGYVHCYSAKISFKQTDFPFGIRTINLSSPLWDFFTTCGWLQMKTDLHLQQAQFSTMLFLYCLWMHIFASNDHLILHEAAHRLDLYHHNPNSKPCKISLLKTRLFG